MNDIIYFVAETFGPDSIGNDVAIPIERMVYCEIASVSQAEFFQASQSGLKAQYKIKMWASEYNGEKTLRIGDNHYKVYRTYNVYDKIELYVNEVI